MGTTIRKFMYIVGIIWTIMVLFIIYKSIEFPFVLQFVISYFIFALLMCLDFIITIFLNIRKSKWSTIRRRLLQFIIGAFVILALRILFNYLIKGELRIMEKIISSLFISYSITFGYFLFEKNNGD